MNIGRCEMWGHDFGAWRISEDTNVLIEVRSCRDCGTPEERRLEAGEQA